MTAFFERLLSFRWAPTTCMLVALALTLLITLCCAFVQIHLFDVQASWPGYTHMVENFAHPARWWRWFIGDISEVAFYKHELASIGLLAGAGLAWWAQRQGKGWQGFAICYGSGLLPWLMFSALLGLFLSQLLWGWTLQTGLWQPTFVAFVSLPSAMVLKFGAGWRVAVAGAVLGALLVAPASLLLVNFWCVPYELPSVIGNVLGMAVGSIVAFILCKRWPVLIGTVATREPPITPAQAATPASYGFVWGARRVLADFSEAPFLGNELASLGLLLGVLLGFYLNPESPAYGSRLLLEMLAGQALASAIGVTLWRKRWQSLGWYPTYIPIVSIVPATVLTYGGAPLVILLSAGLGALIAPPFAHAIGRRLPAFVHGYVANVLSMAVSTLMIVPVVGLALELCK